jgi:hypothetical protein
VVGLDSLIKTINQSSRKRPRFIPHNIKEVEVFYGLPPVRVEGLQYVSGRHNNPQTRRIPSLTGHGAFVSNLDKSGIIEIGVLDGSSTCASIQVTDALGIPFPIAVTDLNTAGTSTLAGSACRLVGTPEWRRGLFPGSKIYTFEVDALMISDGLRTESRA